MGRKKKEKFDDVTVRDIDRATTESVVPQIVGAANKVMVLRKQTDSILQEYDSMRKKRAEDKGLVAPESMADVWEEAIAQQDTNEMLRNYMMQLHVMFQELFQDVYKANTKAQEENDVIWQVYEDSKDIHDLNRFVDAKRYADKDRLQMVNGLQNMAKTIKAIAQEYRQGEMTKALYYHIAEIRAGNALVIATLKQMIPDQSLLNNICDVLEMKFKTIGKPNE